MNSSQFGVACWKLLQILNVIFLDYHMQLCLGVPIDLVPVAPTLIVLNFGALGA